MMSLLGATSNVSYTVLPLSKMMCEVVGWVERAQNAWCAQSGSGGMAIQNYYKNYRQNRAFNGCFTYQRNSLGYREVTNA